MQRFANSSLSAHCVDEILAVKASHSSGPASMLGYAADNLNAKPESWASESNRRVQVLHSRSDQ